MIPELKPKCEDEHGCGSRRMPAGCKQGWLGWGLVELSSLLPDAAPIPKQNIINIIFCFMWIA